MIAPSEKHLDSNYQLVDDPERGLMMFRSDGANLSLNEINLLNAALRNALNTQRRALAQLAEGEILPTAEWVFPETWRDLKNSGDCVYFAVGARRPGWIKIGLTADVFNRRKVLVKGRNAMGSFKVLAYVKTERNADLEVAMHYRFEDIRDGRTEFFLIDPVVEFINQYRPGGEV